MTTVTVPSQAPARLPAARSVAVFCGARPGTPAAVRTAREVGELIGRDGHRLVYGGGGSGLMGELAWSAYRHGAPVLGVVPQFLFERERGIAAPPQAVEITGTMCERKDVMLASADAFIALPGGFGTVDEILDVIALTYLDAHRKPLVLVQPEGEWEEFLSLLAGIVRQGYADPLSTAALHVVDNAAAALAILADALPRRGDGVG